MEIATSSTRSTWRSRCIAPFPGRLYGSCRTAVMGPSTSTRHPSSSTQRSPSFALRAEPYPGLSNSLVPQLRLLTSLCLVSRLCLSPAGPPFSSERLPRSLSVELGRLLGHPRRATDFPILRTLSAPKTGSSTRLKSRSATELIGVASKNENKLPFVFKDDKGTVT